MINIYPQKLLKNQLRHLSSEKKTTPENIEIPRVLAEGMGLEPTRLLHPTRFPGELLSHSVNPPKQPSINLTRGNAFFKINIPCHALCFLIVITCTLYLCFYLQYVFM